MASQEVVRAWRLTASVNWFQNDIDGLDTILFFPTRPEGRARLHLHRHRQRLRAPARHHRQGFTALYQNFLETQVATLALRYRF
jgi:hypothetical protein